MSNTICYLWFERVIYARNAFDYIAIYVIILDKSWVFVTLFSFHNLYNTMVEVNGTAVYCTLLLGVQSPNLNFLYLIQYTRKVYKHIITLCGQHR